MVRTLTNADMLRAAQRKLAAHLEMRPLTVEECEQNAKEADDQFHAAIAKAEQLEDGITNWRVWAKLEGGPGSERLEPGLTETEGKEYLLFARARDFRKYADECCRKSIAWRNMAIQVAAGAYDATTAALRERVAFYAARG